MIGSGCVALFRVIHKQGSYSGVITWYHKQVDNKT
jgi:hypothetical protein